MLRYVTAATVGAALLGIGASDPNSPNIIPLSLAGLRANINKFFDGNGESSVESKLLIVARAKAIIPNATNVAFQDEEIIKHRHEIMKFGYPTMDNIKQYCDHVLAYSNVHKGPLWVCERLADYNVNANKSSSRKESKFIPEGTVHPMFRCYNSDYLNSGYDRGHLAAAANHQHTQLAMNDTFYLSNILPQTGKGLNRTKWNALEKRARALARKHGAVWVMTGPLYLPTVEAGEKFVKYKLIGNSNVAVPTHFFKVIVAPAKEGGYDIESYVMPNSEIRDDIPISSYLVPKVSIEKGAGFFIFDHIADSQYRKINGLQNSDYIH